MSDSNKPVNNVNDSNLYPFHQNNLDDGTNCAELLEPEIMTEKETKEAKRTRELKELLKDKKLFKYYKHELVNDHLNRERSRLFRYKTVVALGSVLVGAATYANCVAEKTNRLLTGVGVAVSSFLAGLWIY